MAELLGKSLFWLAPSGGKHYIGYAYKLGGLWYGFWSWENETINDLQVATATRKGFDSYGAVLKGFSDAYEDLSP